MKSLKKQEEFSKILELEKIDIAELTKNELSALNGGDTAKTYSMTIVPYCNCPSTPQEM